MAQKPDVCARIVSAVEAYMQRYIANGRIAELECSITRDLQGAPSGVSATWVNLPTSYIPERSAGYWWVDKTGRVYEEGRHTSKFNVLTDA